MPYSLETRLRIIEQQLRPSSRYIDAAIRLRVYERGSTVKGVPTDVVSRIYGGRWDRQARIMLPASECPDLHVVERPVSEPQLRYCEDRCARLMGKGGRGGGKSEALAQKAECELLDDPYTPILVLSPDYPHTRIVWRKILLRIRDWVAHVRMADRELVTVFGTDRGEPTIVAFKSAHDPDLVRGFEAGTGLLDEEKDIGAEAYDNFLLCIRLGEHPHIAGVGTPEAGGEYEQRWLAHADDPKARQHSFPSRSNPFISHQIFDLARATMDARRYRQEVEAEFVAMDADAFVFRAEFSRERHCIHFPQDWIDVTRQVTRGKLGKGFRWVVGADYNEHYPNVAHVYRIYGPAERGGRNRWVLHRIVKASGHAGHLAQELMDRGYAPSETVIVDDASGEYNKPGGKKAPNTSARLMRDRGYTLVHPKKNPPVRDRTHAFLAKVNPVVGEPSWFYDGSDELVCELVERTAMLLRWVASGKDIDKNDGVDHDYDAMTYPIAHFEPAAEMSIPKVTVQ